MGAERLINTHGVTALLFEFAPKLLMANGEPHNHQPVITTNVRVITTNQRRASQPPTSQIHSQSSYPVRFIDEVHNLCDS